MRKKKGRRTGRRTQSQIFVSTVKALRTSKKKGLSIRSVAKKSGTTWRTAKRHLDTLRKAGLVETVKRKGVKRKKYKLKRMGA